MPSAAVLSALTGTPIEQGLLRHLDCQVVISDVDCFSFGGMSARNADGIFRTLQHLRQKADQRIIGFAICRRSLQPDFERITMAAYTATAFRIWLNLEHQPNTLLSRAAPRLSHASGKSMELTI
jgi:hypothetical protein